MWEHPAPSVNWFWSRACLRLAARDLLYLHFLRRSRRKTKIHKNVLGSVSGLYTQAIGFSEKGRYKGCIGEPVLARAR